MASSLKIFYPVMISRFSNSVPGRPSFSSYVLVFLIKIQSRLFYLSNIKCAGHNSQDEKSTVRFFMLAKQ